MDCLIPQTFCVLLQTCVRNERVQEQKAYLETHCRLDALSILILFSSFSFGNSSLSEEVSCWRKKIDRYYECVGTTQEENTDYAR